MVVSLILSLHTHKHTHTHIYINIYINERERETIYLIRKIKRVENMYCHIQNVGHRPTNL